MTVNICGVPHKVMECADSYNVNTHFAMIDYMKCEIRINPDMDKAIKLEALCHEMVHGILTHIGYDELAENEQFVQAMGNAIYQGFSIKDYGDEV